MQPSWKSIFVGCSIMVLTTLGVIFWMGHVPRPVGGPPVTYLKTEAESPDLLEAESKKLAGATSIDCGTVPVGENPEAPTACALSAQKAGKPFRVRYDLQGVDSAVAVAVVRTSTGIVGMLNYDSDPSGRRLIGGGEIYPRRCPAPIHLWVDARGRINCFRQSSSSPKDVMSPSLEPY